jgi:hypothetical protein
MNMPALWHTLASLHLLWKLIALDYRYLLEMLGQDATGQESCHTGADNHGMLAAEAAS